MGATQLDTRTPQPGHRTWSWSIMATERYGCLNPLTLPSLTRASTGASLSCRLLCFPAEATPGCARAELRRQQWGWTDEGRNHGLRSTASRGHQASSGFPFLPPEHQYGWGEHG